MKNERRHFLKQASVTGAVFSLLPLLPAGAFASSPSQPEKGDGIGIGVCEMTPEEMSGPYFINNKLLRRNITEDEQGIPLLLTMKIIDSVTCKPLDDILIDIWHCNAMGKYSGWKYINPDLKAPSGDIGTISRTDESIFLRGAQRTDKEGIVRFTTIFPGFYAGRAIHIHLSARSANVQKRQEDKFYFVGQLYFPENISKEVMINDMYSPRGINRLKNEDDSIFSGVKNRAAILTVKKIGDNPLDGLHGKIVLAINKDYLSNKITPKDLAKYTV
ncbi:twin-arginine translocation signal domain-containing protein [Xenorhabdus bovienii]|uniref:intradiol ring-cleavage dioxygenase n=1 Tax=Xenorhabdus bovienii TaxID=40576 RepID=UPI0023B31DC2|nr:twin-arginine translocation signal domain-containing protein [Xenorhabdus bovienii]MDE9556171.1 twin-arginine translocation signal domain-containing protein [Xenorhabdus bovienii]